MSDHLTFLSDTIDGMPKSSSRPGSRGSRSEVLETPEAVSRPISEIKAELFKALAHPARIRALEVLAEGERSVGELTSLVGIEASHLSQQLAVLRRANLVVTRKEGSTVHYSLTDPRIAELLRVAREILSGVLAGQAELLADLRAPLPGASRNR